MISKYSLILSLVLGGDSVVAFQVPLRPILRGATRATTTTVLYAEDTAKGSSKSSNSKTSKTKKSKGGRKAAAVQEVVAAVTAIPIADFPNTPIVMSPPVDEKLEGYLGPQVSVPDLFQFDLTGGRPGSIIESEEDLNRKEEILEEMESGERDYPDWMEEYGSLVENEEAEYDTDDPEAIDASTLGQYDITDLGTKFDYEWDPETQSDPNIITETTGFIEENPKDEEGVELGYDPMFGPSNPVDTRTKTGARDSYMIDDNTRDNAMLTPEFHPGDIEIKDNHDFREFRKSLDIIESYVDDFLPSDMTIPRHVAKWHGYPEELKYPPQNYTNNRFTAPEDLTNFDGMDAFRARRKAVELARAKNAEWLPDGMSQAWHQSQRQIYETRGTLVGSLRKAVCDPDVVELIQPALNVLGSCTDLLSIEHDTVFRFHYHGLIKNKHGMAAWTETLIRDCGVEVTGVIFETGFRRRDPAYDGGDPYFGFD
jgi:hypothetical protein